MKKSQIQMGESLAVVVIVIVIIFLGIVIYYQFWKAGQETEFDAQRDIEAISLATRTSYLPELHCTIQGRVSSNCFDKIKLEYMQSHQASSSWQNYYFDYFGYAKIEMIEVYPGPLTNYTIYENQKSVTQSEQPIFIPSRVFNPITGKNKLAYLQVTKFT